MIFIVYSPISEEKFNGGSLGMPEYSYYFVLRDFLPVLRELGQVIAVKNPEQEVDAIYDDCRRRGESCVFLMFSPPHKSLVGLRCPTVCVLAWEYDPIPYEVWDDDPKNDWRFVLSDHGRMISLSQYTADSVKRMMGENFSVATIAAPVWDAFADFRNRAGDIADVRQSEIMIQGTIVDSRNYLLAPDSFDLLNPESNFQFQEWSGETLNLSFCKGDEFAAYLGGFYQPEKWGTWSRLEEPWVLLPCRLNGVVHLKITACGYAGNFDREIFVSLGDEKKQIRLKNFDEEIHVSFQLSKPESILKFSNLDLSPVLNVTDPTDTRSLALGLRSVEISRYSLQDWRGEILQLGFTKTDECGAYLDGFYQSEDWGAWSRIEEPLVLLPYRLSGIVHLKIAACGYAGNFNRDIFVALGDEKKQFRLKNFDEEIHVSFQLNRPESVLRFSGLDLSPAPNAADPRSMGIGLRSIEISGYPLPEWSGEILQLGFAKADKACTYLEGFYQPEDWGAWSRIEEPLVSLPCFLNGAVHLKIAACGYASNFNRDIFVALGDKKKQIRLKDFDEEIEVSFRLDRPENVIKFSGLDLSPAPNAADPRSMGIGLRSIEISGCPCEDDAKVIEQTCALVHKVVLEGVVYTSVFNPRDGRKNWRDIITAFCAAFQDVEDATLVLKMSNYSLSSFLGKLHYYLQQLSPFKCRIVALHGYMDSDEYEKLIAATHFYVNASRCEGLCLPLMEYMACLKPSISPCHTAMADYVDSSTTLIVDSSLEPCIWPHDSRKVFRAMWYRIDWESLVNAYRRSYDIVKNKSAVYGEMGKSASLQIKKVASHNVVKEKLKKFLTKELGCQW